jgi:hypothetical protein
VSLGFAVGADRGRERLARLVFAVADPDGEGATASAGDEG